MFRNAGKIVHKEMYDRFNGDFTPVDFRRHLKPERAIFDVYQQGVSANGKPWFRLKLRASGSITSGKDES
ncbi:MAG: hypothetical protein PVI38_07360 [Desulfobacterales bacterium]